MSGRVLSSDAAKGAIAKFGQIVNGDLQQQLKALDDQGRILSESTNWDGKLAVEFRGKWQQTNVSLQKIRDALNELQGNIQKINDNILRAGGNE
jgi:uncharacterized protein YukE